MQHGDAAHQIRLHLGRAGVLEIHRADLAMALVAGVLVMTARGGGGEQQ
jgi:hypothetical protein